MTDKKPYATALLLCLLSSVFSACEPPPPADGSLGSLELGIVLDSSIFKSVQAFQIHVIKAKAKDNSRVTCADFPKARSAEDSSLVHVGGSPINIQWSGATSEATVEQVEVPADQELLVVVLGLTKVGQVYTVARGCEEGLSFAPGVMGTVNVDVQNTTGAPCQTADDCDNGMTCQNSGQAFQGGYCAKIGCGGDADCPPGSNCITNDETGGICLRHCEVQADCTYDPPNQAVQECVGRVGPTSGGCGSVCIYPTWNTANTCQP